MAENNSGPEKHKDDNLSVGAKGGAVAFILKISATGLGFLNQIVLARILGAEGIGEVLLALSIVKVAALIAKFGMEETMMRFVPLYIVRKDYARLKGTIYFGLKFCLLLSIFLGFLIWFFSGFISRDVFHSEGLLKLLPFIAVALPANVFYEVTGGILKGYKDTFRALLPQFFVSPFLRLVIFLLLSIRGGTPLYAVAAFLSGEIISMFLSIIFLYKKAGRIRTAERKSEYKKTLKVAFTMISAGVSVFLFTNTDLWILGMFVSTEAVGIYGVTAKLVTLVVFSLGALSTIIPPLISSMYTSGNLNELRRVVRESSRWILSTAVPVILVLILEGNFILKYFFGEKFTAGYAALLILAAGQLINAGCGLVGYLLQMTGGHKKYMKIAMFWGVVNVILNIILVPRMGIIGAAPSTAFCLAMVNIVAMVEVYRKFRVLTLAERLKFDIIFAAVVGGLYFLCRYNNFASGYHILLAGSLTVYISKSMAQNDIPWRLLFSKYKSG